MTNLFKRRRSLWAALLTGLLAAVLLCVSAAAAVGAVLPTLPKDRCIVDDAGVLSEETLAYFDELNGRLETHCKGAQVFALTVQYTGNLSTEDYALEAFNTWGVGSSKENNGLLILLVMECQEFEDGDYYMIYGDGFAGTLLSSQLTPVYNSMEDAFAAGDYDTALRTAATNAARLIANVYGTETALVLPTGGAENVTKPSGGPVTVTDGEPEEEDTILDMILYLIVFLIAAAALLGGLGAVIFVPIAVVFGVLGGIGRLFGGGRRSGPHYGDRGHPYTPPPPPGGFYGSGYTPPRTGRSYHVGGNSSHYHSGGSWGGSSSGRSSGSNWSSGSSGRSSSSGSSYRSSGSGGGRSHGGGGGRRR